jgi:hypothetical protein
LAIIPATANTESFLASWLIPPEAMTKAGDLQIKLSFSDKAEGQTVYSWNSATYSGLKIAPSMENNEVLGFDEFSVLRLNINTRNIIAPAGYNNIVALQGDRGVSKVHFQIPKEIAGIEVKKGTIYIKYYADDNIKGTYQCTDSDIQSHGDERLITWNVPEEITARVGNFSVALYLKADDGRKTIATWQSNQYNALQVGPALLPENIITPAIEGKGIFIDANNTQPEGYISYKGISSIRVIEDNAEGLSDEKIQKGEIVALINKGNNGNYKVSKLKIGKSNDEEIGLAEDLL